MRTMMKKVSILIFLWIFAVGIVANANIQLSEDEIGHTIQSKVQSAVGVNSPTQTSNSDPKTIVFLLGVGLVGIVTFSRRN
jgi:chromate transport protein ChrA